MRILLGGEGPNELGYLARPPSYRDPAATGVIEELLQKVRRGGWRVVDGVLWKQIRKYRAGGYRKVDTRVSKVGSMGGSWMHIVSSPQLL